MRIHFGVGEPVRPACGAGKDLRWSHQFFADFLTQEVEKVDCRSCWHTGAYGKAVSDHYNLNVCDHDWE